MLQVYMSYEYTLESLTIWINKNEPQYLYLPGRN